jgi:predicted nucleic acid-binding protein
MSGVLVDSNVLLDLFTRDPKWYDWSSKAVERLGNANTLVLNPIIYAEVSIHFADLDAVNDALPPQLFQREAVPFDAAFLAGKVFARYRARGGNRIAPLPDFFIGAHASIAGYPLLTRNPKHYRRDFPKLKLIAP